MKRTGVMPFFSIYTLFLGAGLAGLVVASISDVKTRLIYDEIVAFVFGTGVVLRLMATPEFFWVSLLISAVLLVLLGQGARFNMIGGGDAKLIAATVWLFPPQHSVWLLAHIALAGGVLSCFYLLARAVLRRSNIIPAGAERAFPAGAPYNASGNALINEFAKISAGEPMPYALAILAGTSYSIASEVLHAAS
jgi:prepilin peptidase CpaA